MRHLSDFDFQDYLDGNYIPEDSFIREHLETCNMCRHQLHVYKNLYAELNNEITWSLPDDFADAVIEKLPAVNPPGFAVFKFLSSDIFLILSCISGFLGGLVYYIIKKYTTQSVLDAFKTDYDFTQLLLSIKEKAALIPASGMYYLLLCVFILLAVVALDKLVFQQLSRKIRA